MWTSFKDPCLSPIHMPIIARKKLQYLDCEHAIQGSISPQIFLFQANGPLANTSFVKMQIHFCWYLLAQSPEEFLIIWLWCPEVVVVVAWIMLSLWSFFHVTNLYLKWVSKLRIRSLRKPWTTCTNSNFLVRTQMYQMTVEFYNNMKAIKLVCQSAADILHQSESKSCKVHVKELVVAKEETSLE